MQGAERDINAGFCPGGLDLWPWPSNSSERGTKHVFRVNLAQICSAVPDIFHTQTKSHRQRQKKGFTVKTSRCQNVLSSKRPKVITSPVKTSLHGQNVPSQIVPSFDCWHRIYWNSRTLGASDYERARQESIHDVLIHVLQLAACRNN